MKKTKEICFSKSEKKSDKGIMNELETLLFLKFVDQQKFDKNLEYEVLYLDILYCKQYFFCLTENK